MHVLKKRFNFFHNMECIILEIFTSITRKNNNIKDMIKSNLNCSKLKFSIIQKGKFHIFSSQLLVIKICKSYIALAMSHTIIFIRIYTIIVSIYEKNYHNFIVLHSCRLR